MKNNQGFTIITVSAAITKYKRSIVSLNKRTFHKCKSNTK